MAGKDTADLMRSLDALTISELEALLQKDFIASIGGAADIDYITAIIRVILMKEAAQPGHRSVDVDKAWEDLWAVYYVEEAPTTQQSLPLSHDRSY